MEKKVYKVCSLFAGVGGICQAFKDIGFDIIWANEIDHFACETYKVNMEHKYSEECNYLIKGDIQEVLNSDINIPDFDILVAGFPCQSFSIAGERKGLDDKRGQLFYRIIDLISIKNPEIVFLENVKNLLSHDNGNTFKIIKSELENKGYFVKYNILNSSEYANVPQNRERIYIICSRNRDHIDKFIWPCKIPLQKKLEDIINQSERKPDKYYYIINENIKKFKNSLIKEKYERFLKDISDAGCFYQIRRGMYVRKNKKGVCPTLTANMGSGGHNVPLIKDNFGVRKLTPEECFLLQGFDNFKRPEKMKDSHLYKQAGNSVVIPVIKLIAQAILDVLEE